ncbi:hypothetical protein SAMN05216315_11657 [Nitrosospira sp. Nsp18]|uniref:hypothetical protein n=1 Tax=Nitrosospira sp. Nsp18 TaxID=1855334 RepID=UPI0008823338|nr:hypothetical protein [Nitrosospira sp. Nsp18]SDA21527.1 hypothetical protein SAMN05216315_11657 [Nitrosospira sp. Nsp18]
MRLTPVVPLLINFALGIRGRQESLRIVALLSQASIEAFQQALPVSLTWSAIPRSQVVIVPVMLSSFRHHLMTFHTQE